jgi:hypothetical protein
MEFRLEVFHSTGAGRSVHMDVNNRQTFLTTCGGWDGGAQQKSEREQFTHNGILHVIL